MNISRTRRFVVACIAVLAVVASVTPFQFASGQPSREAADKHDGTLLNLTVELYAEVFNEGKAAGAERLIADDAIIHTPRGTFTGPDGLLEYLDGLSRIYPNASFDVTSIVIDGDTIVVEWTMTATRFQLDPNHGPSFAEVSSPGETTITVADGQVAEMNQAGRGMAVQPAEEIAAQSQTEQASGSVTVSRSANPVQ